ncbi:calcium uptake mitochondrial-like [Chlorella sorokiniana]|uniref:Calcium uptake mitochondrial-like n=1 Tax=Chlorella sorokiniana TaxID=3076 RepID=A0A2P6TUK6_CHLSO|nr:calcium uptake mitochondrial-like [Chlorella sorokiniana]|eukprot:PRW57749.1 calcium uptake mitochondrial-like [Chlorella sorokiniana]
MSLDQRRRMFFKYEKRIRELSPPEKVFEYFASQRDGKVFTMTAGDMMRSVVPVFPPEGSEVVRAGSLPGEPSPKVANEEASAFIRQFDMDGDDRVNFDEYLLFQTLLSIPLSDVEVAFRIIDRDGSGAVSRDEFAQLLDALHSQASRPSISLRKSAATTESDLHGLMVVFFGKDGRKSLSLAAFRQFICDLREELLRLEFEYYDWRHQGSISGRDFAHSVVSCARLKHVDQYLDKVEAMPSDLATQRVTYAEFRQFRDMWRQLRLLAVALEFQLNTSGRMGRQEFGWTVQHVMDVKLAPHLVDTLFFLFADQAGILNVNYMYEVMNRHYTTGLNVAYRFNKPPAAKSYFDCLRECKAKTGA